MATWSETSPQTEWGQMNMQPEETHRDVMNRLRAMKPRPGKRRTENGREMSSFKAGSVVRQKPGPKQKKVRSLCADPECGEFSTKLGMCDLHYSRDLRRRKREAAEKEED
jgi:hypothetical protein